MFHGGAVQVIEQHVAALGVAAIGLCRAILEQEVAFESELRRCGRGLPRMVRLRGALGQHHIGIAVASLGEQKFQLACLVTAARQAGAIVALDPHLRTAERAAEARQVLERSG